MEKQAKDNYSKNKYAEEVMGKRNLGKNVIPFDQPCELGYYCPVCKNKIVYDDGGYDERLEWSEYNGFIWCSVCDKDYPSCLCKENIDDGTNVFLDIVKEHKNKRYCSVDEEGLRKSIREIKHNRNGSVKAKLITAWDDEIIEAIKQGGGL